MIFRSWWCSKLNFLKSKILHECTSIYIFKHLIFLLKIHWKTIWKFCHLSIYRYLITSMFFFQRNFVLEHTTASNDPHWREQAVSACKPVFCVWCQYQRLESVSAFTQAPCSVFHVTFHFSEFTYILTKMYCNTAPYVFGKNLFFKN